MKITTTILALLVYIGVFAQAPTQRSAGEIQHAIQKLATVGSVLYIAAHPDDENTRMIAYFANERKMNTAYLSLTRGDGGQNLIGPEIRELMGLMRTQELLMARRVDGGEQFFSRANDFGYSKNAEETFTIWEREQVLADMVWIIRNYRPDVLMTRFPHTAAPTHGHHTASAQLAYEAFDAAADPKRFPEQLTDVDVWQAKRLLYNVIPHYYGDDEAFEAAKKDLLAVDVGAYYPLLGKSNNEISAESRSQHKCQGMGTMSERGTSIEYLEHLKGERTTSDIFEGINTSWTRIGKEGKAIDKALRKLNDKFDASNPAASISDLLLIRKKINSISDNYYSTIKIAEIDAIIKDCLGLYLAANVDDFSAMSGWELNLSVEAINRSDLDVKIQTIYYDDEIIRHDDIIPLRQNVPFLEKQTMIIHGDDSSSRPYWLRETGTLGMYKAAKKDLLHPENQEDVSVEFKLSIEGESIKYKIPVTYKRNDPVDGEVHRDFEIEPEMSFNIQEKVIVFANNEPKTIHVLAKAGRPGVSGLLKIQLPEGWHSEPESQKLGYTNEKGEEQTVAFQIFPSKNQSTGELELIWKSFGEGTAQQRIEINYPHIPVQLLFLDAKAKVVKINLEKRGDNIAYYMGAGDDIPANLEQIGYRVTLLKDSDMTLDNLQKYDALIMGVRAYNTRPRLKFHQKTLMEYVEKGGTMIVQYNTSFRLVTEYLGPYQMNLSRDRVTVEGAEVRFLLPEHPVLNTPNKITAADFDGWVQERGLYFPNEWDEKYAAILSSNDPNEPPRNGGLLVAEYGEGHFIYTGYSWFRELPAGVPGAYRVFANLISIGK